MKLNLRNLLNKTNGTSGNQPGPVATSVDVRPDIADKPKRKVNVLVIVGVFLVVTTVFGGGTYLVLSNVIGNPSSFYKTAGPKVIPPVSPAVSAASASGTAAASVSPPSSIVKPGDKPQQPVSVSPIGQGSDIAYLDIKTQNPFKAEFLKKLNSAKNVNGDAPAFKGRISQLPPPPMVQLPPPPPPKKLPTISVYGVASFEGKKYAFTSAGKLLEKDKIGDAEVLEIKENGIQFDAGFLPLSKGSASVHGVKK